MDFGIGETLAIGGAMAAAQGGMAVYQASERNKSISRSAVVAKQGAEFEQQQQGRIAGIQTTRAAQQAARVRGLIAVSAASRGVGVGGSVAALEKNADQQGGLDKFAIDTNRYGAEQRTLATLRNVNATLQSESSNAFLSGLTGAISGFSTGLSIGHTVGSVGPSGAIDDAPFMSELKPVWNFK